MANTQAHIKTCTYLFLVVVSFVLVFLFAFTFPRVFAGLLMLYIVAGILFWLYHWIYCEIKNGGRK